MFCLQSKEEKTPVLLSAAIQLDVKENGSDHQSEEQGNSHLDRMQTQDRQ